MTREPALDTPALLREGHEARDAYDYDLAKERFEAALAESAGAVEPPGAGGYRSRACWSGRRAPSARRCCCP